MFPHHFDYNTNCTVTGGAQFGKSSLLELMAREVMKTPKLGLFSLDPHGRLYERLVGYAAYMKFDRPIVCFNFSQPTMVRPLSIFNRNGPHDASAFASRGVDAIIRAWGAENADQTPTLARLLHQILTVADISGEPLQHVARLLSYPKREHREWAVEILRDYSEVADSWAELQYIKGQDRWVKIVEATRNRLYRFVTSTSVKLFTGLQTNAISIPDLIRARAIVLVNLCPSDDFPIEARSAMMSLFLSQFLYAALANISKPIPYIVMIDEAASVLDTQTAGLLDQVLKSGMRLTLAFHHLGQFHDQPHLQESLAMNARINFIFGGQPLHESKRLAEEFHLGEINKEKIRRVNPRTITMIEEEPYETHTHTSLPGGDSSDSISSSTRPVAHHYDDPGSVDVWGRDEKIAMMAERIHGLKKQECYVRLPNKTVKWPVPTVRAYLPTAEMVLEFKKKVHAKSTPINEAKQHLKDAERTFLERSHDYAGPGRPKRKKGPSRLHPQG